MQRGWNFAIEYPSGDTKQNRGRLITIAYACGCGNHADANNKMKKQKPELTRFEQELTLPFRLLEEKGTITFKDWEKVKIAFSNAFIKIQRQREQLESSRDLKLQIIKNQKVEIENLKSKIEVLNAKIKEYFFDNETMYKGKKIKQVSDKLTKQIKDEV